MGSFKLWFEAEQDKEKVLHRAYDLALEKLLGGDRENLSLSLSRIKAGGGGRDEEEGRSACRRRIAQAAKAAAADSSIGNGCCCRRRRCEERGR